MKKPKKSKSPESAVQALQELSEAVAELKPPVLLVDEMDTALSKMQETEAVAKVSTQIPVSLSDFVSVLFCAFRYSLGRQSYITHDCVDWLEACWSLFDPYKRMQIQSEIREAIGRHEAGMLCDVEQWKEVLGWPLTINGEVAFSNFIQGECHSDDYAARALFNATPFFRQATAEQIQALTKCGWRGDYPADAVALYLRNFYPDVGTMFDYLEVVNRVRTQDQLGFECIVNESQAREWLKAHRPEIVLEEEEKA